MDALDLNFFLSFFCPEFEFEFEFTKNENTYNDLF